MEITNYQFNFIIPKIIFGNGRIKKLAGEIQDILKPQQIKEPKVLLVTGKNSLKQSGYLEIIRSDLKKAHISVNVYDKAGKEPTTSILNKGRDEFIEKGCDLIVGAGGGSVMDTAKGIAGLASNGGVVEDYHAGREFIKPPVPFILIPTTAGTGSEVTNNAVIKDQDKGIKKSIRGLYATVALLDPEITLSLPKKFTAYPGADALVQAIESLVSKASNYISDLFAKESIKFLGKSLPGVYDDLENLELREKMMLGSLLGAISFANGKLGAVHGFAHPIGIQHNIPHGLICGLLLPYVMEYNITLEHVIDRYAWIAELFHSQKILPEYGKCPSILPKERKEKAKWVIQKIKDIFTYIEIPLHLTEIGITEDHLDEIVNDTKGSSLDNNPRDTNTETLKNILLNAL